MKKYIRNYGFLIICLLLCIVITGCQNSVKTTITDKEPTKSAIKESSDLSVTPEQTNPLITVTPSPTPVKKVPPFPTWYVDARCFFKGAAGDFDETSVKDPSIVYYDNQYYLYYTGVTKKGEWKIGFATAPTIEELSSAKHTYCESISEGYFCAPQVFYYEPQKLWYMIYNDGTYGAAYATTTDIADPTSWKGPQSLGLAAPTGYDFWVICDDKAAYLFYTENGTSKKILRRTTSLESFPTGWGDPTTVAYDSFEGVCVYHSQADGMYYMLPEDYYDNRYYELWSASSLDGLWKQISEKWASQRNIKFNEDHWTDNVSHGDILRTSVNQKQEIEDINKVDFLIQGVVNGDYEDYAHIPWELGIIRNYTKE